MTYPFDSNNLPIVDLHIFHDQLMLGAAVNDVAYLHHVLSNSVNVENYIQIYAQSKPQAIELLFQSLRILDGQNNSQQLISNILHLVYSHYHHQLSQTMKTIISDYTGLNEDQLNTMVQELNLPFYYSDGIKRQRFEPEQDKKENGSQNVNSEVYTSKKHELDLAENSLAKRQRVKPLSPPNKRDVPSEDYLHVEHASKRKRFFK